MLLFVVHFFVPGRRATVGVRAALRGPRGRTGTHPDISYASCFRPATRGSMWQSPADRERLPSPLARCQTKDGSRVGSAGTRVPPPEASEAQRHCGPAAEPGEPLVTADGHHTLGTPNGVSPVCPPTRERVARRPGARKPRNQAVFKEMYAICFQK